MFLIDLLLLVAATVLCAFALAFFAMIPFHELGVGDSLLSSAPCSGRLPGPDRADWSGPC